MMGALSELLCRANAANPANRRTSARLSSQSSHDSQAEGTEFDGCRSRVSQKSYVRALRNSLRQAAITQGLPVALALDLEGADVLACASLSCQDLLNHMRTLARSQQMAAGNVPVDWTHSADCAGCGTVPLWPGMPQSVVACPWCWHRRAGQVVPRRPGD